MMTIFTIPKVFDNHFGILQENAIRSWREECPNSEILLMGKEKGTEEAAKKFQAKYIPDIKINAWGTPYLNRLVEKASQIAKFKILALINTDCILVGNLERAIETVCKQFPQFLAIGTRYDSEIRELLPASNWRPFVLKHKGMFHPLTRRVQGKDSIGGMDIWIFPKTLYPRIPPFLMGRLNWDSWLVSNAYERHILLIDITGEITLVHQAHSLNRYEEMPAKAEVEINRNLVIRMHKKFVRDADFIFKDGEFKKDKRVSLFTYLNPLSARFETTQRNALRSWQMTNPNGEIILANNDLPLGSLCDEFPQIFQTRKKVQKLGKRGVSMRSIFKRGNSTALFGVQGYLNPETLLIGNLEKIILRVKNRFRRFLLIGRKWQIPSLKDFTFRDNWLGQLYEKLKTEGKLCGPEEIAYLIFTNDTFFWRDFPPFLLEGTLWENWLIGEALRRKVHVIDISPVITAIHLECKIGDTDTKNDTLITEQEPFKSVNSAQFIFTTEGIRERSK